MNRNIIQRFNEFSTLNEREYWGTIGAGILPYSESTGKYLVAYRSAAVYEPNTWGVFGGKLDIDEGIDETIEEAAIREMEEETEYYGDIKLVKGYVYKDGSFEYHNYIGNVPDEFSPELNWENEKAVWMTFDDIKQLTNKHFGLTAFIKESPELFK